MALLAQLARGCTSKITKFPIEVAASTICVHHFSSRVPYDTYNNTKARRARELRPRRNYLKNDDVEKHRSSFLQDKPVLEEDVDQQPASVPRDFRHVMPEFLPNPNPLMRDRISERLERMDMYQRRAVIDIPEFYVGSIMAVTMADKYAPGKQTRFVGICIDRGGHGLRANFILRNYIDGQGVEILFDLYNPTLQKIEVLKLEKRLDDQLFYLRDAPPEYSTVPFDFQPVPLPRGATVPINSIKVKLNPRPWLERWERMNLQGIEDLELPEKFYIRAKAVAKPWEKYDLMKQYRASVNDDEAATIMKEVLSKTGTTKRMGGQQKISLRKGR
ncbi:hypothetical protein BaRGS_00005578 [Batillaria attramentaria]|uniref:Large ribosomal subunit protein bL19m n=1 Tax=Batillaria attramentaria TaxID=370345 RepID=A0ABD0LW35_9CAEN